MWDIDLKKHKMLIKYSNTPEHVMAYSNFQKRLGHANANGEFKNPFSYYGQDSKALVSLWLLISENEVIASVISKKQTYLISGVEEDVYFLKYPVSLSIVDPNYTMAAVQLTSEIKKKFKYSFLLGMGGLKSRTAKFFAAARFINIDIPFYIKVISWKSLLLHNPLVSRVLPLKNRLPRPKFKIEPRDVLSLEYVDEYKGSGSWKNSSFTLLRNNDILNEQTPSEKLPFLKFEVMLKGKKIGGVLVLETAPRKHRYFGNLNLWTVLELEIDCSKDIEKSVSQMIAKFAYNRGVDVLLINSGARRHREFCENSKWKKITSNYCISLSPKLAASCVGDDIYITRLDGDGPINLGIDL